jgi:DNA-binding NarL/FixJ family response regulator
MTPTYLLVEDDAATRDWLAQMLRAMNPAPQVVALGTAAEAQAWLQNHEPEVLLIDLGLPDQPGTEVIRAAAQRYPRCDILVITVFGDEQHVVAALEAGASGYLLKDSSLENIREHLAYLRLGGSPMTPRIARLLIRQHRSHRLPYGDSGPGALEGPATSTAGGLPTAASPSSSAGAAGPELTERELQVLTGIAKGFTYAEVAQMLGLSINTVGTHVKRIYQKLAVNSGIEAVYEFNQRQSQRGQPPLV